MLFIANKEFIDIFRASKAVSLEKGKSHYLARKPKESKQHLFLEKAEEEDKESNRTIKLLKLKKSELNSKIEDIEGKLSDNEDYTEKISKLYNLGIIDESGNPINNDMRL